MFSCVSGWKTYCCALAAVLSCAVRSICFFSLLGFPEPNHLRVAGLVHGNLRRASVYSPWRPSAHPSLSVALLGIEVADKCSKATRVLGQSKRERCSRLLLPRSRRELPDQLQRKLNLP